MAPNAARVQKAPRQEVNCRSTAPQMGAMIGAMITMACTTARTDSRFLPLQRSLTNAVATAVAALEPTACRILNPMS